MAHLRHVNTPGPFLIAGPLATLPNWLAEFKKWLPSCPVILYHGSKAERAALRAENMPVGDAKLVSFPVVITSFEICMIDRPFLEKYHWQYLILDEGVGEHAIFRNLPPSLSHIFSFFLTTHAHTHTHTHIHTNRASDQEPQLPTGAGAKVPAHHVPPAANG